MEVVPPTLRQATADDFDAFRAVYEPIAAEGRWIGGELPVDWEARRSFFVEGVTDPRRFVLLAEADDGTPVGWISAEQEAGGRVAFGMGIVDGHRSTGLGTQLLAAVLGWAKHRGAHKVVLEVWPTNRRAIGLYEKFGFVVEGRHPRHWRRNDGSLWDSLSMGLVLDTDAPGGPPSTG